MTSEIRGFGDSSLGTYWISILANSVRPLRAADEYGRSKVAVGCTMDDPAAGTPSGLGDGLRFSVPGLGRSAARFQVLVAIRRVRL